MPGWLYPIGLLGFFITRPIWKLTAKYEPVSTMLAGFIGWVVIFGIVIRLIIGAID